MLRIEVTPELVFQMLSKGNEIHAKCTKGLDPGKKYELQSIDIANFNIVMVIDDGKTEVDNSHPQFETLYRTPDLCDSPVVTKDKDQGFGIFLPRAVEVIFKSHKLVIVLTRFPE